jgi:hypothetical protein
MINEHDMTKSMLDKMRSTLLREVNNPSETMGEPQSNDTASAPKEIVFIDGNGNLNSDLPANMKVYWDGTESEKKKFMDGVSPNVTFTSFSITPKDGGDEGDVKLSGVLNDFGIGFVMNKKQNLGLRITTTPPKVSQPGVSGEGLSSGDVKLTPELIGLLNKLNGYYENWYKEWATKLNTENFGNV